MGFLQTLKAKLTGKKKDKKQKETKEQTVAAATTEGGGDVHILPVPGNTNEPPQVGGGLNSNPEKEILRGPGPVIPDAATASALEPPKTREELRARAEELNQS
ncbi:hypothetical protein CPB86DRAFT_496991 [Serendipita vermifera]|nr:hypothetical protein CPB86DRAFT_496991 [Serendipita vermifera]